MSDLVEAAARAMLTLSSDEALELRAQWWAPRPDHAAARPFARAALLAALDAVDDEGMQRAICLAGGGDPDRMMDGYIRTPDSENIQYDQR